MPVGSTTKNYLQFLLWTSVLLIVKALTDADECKNYVEISDWRRSIANKMKSKNESICDTHLYLKWYRFTSPAGGLMPTKCPPLHSCGSISPVWINGSLPSESDNDTFLNVCGRYKDDCCAHSWQIKARKCKETHSSFYVFYLIKTLFCMAYCAGTEKPCEDGYTSPNGFTPGCKRITTTTKTAMPPTTSNRRLSSTMPSTATLPITNSTTEPTSRENPVTSTNKSHKKKTLVIIMITVGCSLGLALFFAIGYVCGKNRHIIKNSIGCTTVDNKMYNTYEECL